MVYIREDITPGVAGVIVLSYPAHRLGVAGPRGHFPSRPCLFLTLLLCMSAGRAFLCI